MIEITLFGIQGQPVKSTFQNLKIQVGHGLIQNAIPIWKLEKFQRYFWKAEIAAFTLCALKLLSTINLENIKAQTLKMKTEEVAIL